MTIFDKIYLTLWMWSFSFASFIAKRKKFALVTRMLMRFFAWQSLLIRHGRKKFSLQEVVFEWQRMFPSKEINHIKSIGNDTAYAEVRVQCPLRGSGDVMTCYRMMEYDRAMLEKIGGQLVVLHSQAEPEVEICEVALKIEGANTDDLIPAHKRV